MCSSNTSNLGSQHVRCSLHVGMGQNEAFGVTISWWEPNSWDTSNFDQFWNPWPVGKLPILGYPSPASLDQKIVVSCVFMDSPVKMSQVLVLVPENNWSRVTSKKLLSRYRMIEMDRSWHLLQSRLPCGFGGFGHGNLCLMETDDERLHRLVWSKRSGWCCEMKSVDDAWSTTEKGCWLPISQYPQKTDALHTIGLLPEPQSAEFTHIHLAKALELLDLYWKILHGYHCWASYSICLCRTAVPSTLLHSHCTRPSLQNSPKRISSNLDDHASHSVSIWLLLIYSSHVLVCVPFVCYKSYRNMLLRKQHPAVHQKYQNMFSDQGTGRQRNQRHPPDLLQPQKHRFAIVVALL